MLLEGFFMTERTQDTTQKFLPRGGNFAFVSNLDHLRRENAGIPQPSAKKGETGSVSHPDHFSRGLHSPA
jgi:hypothetical protein